MIPLKSLFRLYILTHVKEDPMFKILSLSLLALFAVNVLGRVEVSQQGDLINYEFSDLSISTENLTIEGSEFIRTKLVGADDYEAILFELGMPEIPVIRFYAPQGEVEVVLGDEKDFGQPKGLAMDLVPNLESLEKIKGSTRKLIINKSFQKSSAYYPAKKFEISNGGTTNGNQEQLITVYPLTWNPSSKSIKLVKNFQVIVKPAVQEQTKSLEVETMVFVIGGQFKNSPAIAQYENFKKQLGFNVVRIIVEGSVNTPEAIRTKLQELLKSTNLKYALIFGDAEHVPAKKSNIISGVTDHFYAAIDTNNYAQDINGPDIGVGRVTIKNETELQNVVDKFIKYQTTNFTTDEWLSNASFLATNDRYTVAEGSHNYVIDSFMTNHGYSGIFPNAAQPGGDKLYAITYRVKNEQVINAISAGRSIIDYSGHGATTFWDAPRFTQANVRDLNHSAALPFVISNACITGQFTVNESFAETWIKHPHGAIMFWGSMDSTYWDEDDFLERDTFKGIFELKKATFSEITHYGLKELWRRYNGQNRAAYYWETYLTFGDPSIKLKVNGNQDFLAEVLP